MSSSTSSNNGRKRKTFNSVGGEPTTAALASAPSSIQCPYLDTIQRSVLDFDLEPACSVSLVTGPHIYVCLVCGKYFRGRGVHTPAYTHAVEESHFVFLHLSKATFHCLPDNYEIHDASLHDIRDALHPTYDSHHLRQLDSSTELSRDLFGRLYLPGFVGLNNLHKTDGINAVVQALAHVRPLRDYFLRQSNSNNTNGISTKNDAMLQQQQQYRAACSVTAQFGALIRQLWSDRRFKSHVDPHMLVNAVSAASGNKFGAAGKQVDAGQFLAWFLHQLHLGTGGATVVTKKRKQIKSSQQPNSIVEQIFQGRVRITTRQAKRESMARANHGGENDDDRAGSDAEEDNIDRNDSSAPKDEESSKSRIKIEETTVDNHFLQLTLDLSEKPLFRDEDGGLVIPQEPLVTVLKKFDGVTFSDALTRSGLVQRRRYALQRLPDYLILHLARFKNNVYSREKNPTIVAFPVKNLDLTDYVQPPEGGRPVPPTADDVQKMSVRYQI